MTNEMTVQQNKSYAKPGLIVGGLAGAGAAAAALEWKPEWTIQTQNITSWDDLLKVKDQFVASKAAKEGEVGTNWTLVKTHKDAVKEATDNVFKELPGDLKENEAAKKWVSSVIELADAEEKELAKLIEQYGKGTNIEGVAKDLTGDELTKAIKESEPFKKAIKTKSDAVKEAVANVEGVNDNISKAVRNKADDLVSKNKTAQEALKDIFTKLKSPSAMWTYIAGAVGLAVIGLGIGSMIKSKKEA